MKGEEDELLHRKEEDGRVELRDVEDEEVRQVKIIGFSSSCEDKEKYCWHSWEGDGDLGDTGSFFGGDEGGGGGVERDVVGGVDGELEGIVGEDHSTPMVRYGKHTPGDVESANNFKKYYCKKLKLV